MDNRLTDYDDEYEGIELGNIDSVTTNTIMGCLIALIVFAIIGAGVIIYQLATKLF